MRFRFLSLAIALVAGSAHAGGVVRDYNSALFNNLQSFGEPVVLIVTRGNCADCGAKESALQSLASARRYASITVLKIDADKNTSEARSLGVRQDTTAIAFHGFNETGRATRTSDMTKLDDVFTSTLH